MYISLKDSSTRGFKKWADTHQPNIKSILRASEGNGLVATSPDQDNSVMTTFERPHRPWLVPGVGML